MGGYSISDIMKTYKGYHNQKKAQNEQKKAGNKQKKAENKQKNQKTKQKNRKEKTEKSDFTSFYHGEIVRNWLRLLGKL